jgi:uncharacterized membrane protein
VKNPKMSIKELSEKTGQSESFLKDCLGPRKKRSLLKLIVAWIIVVLAGLALVAGLAVTFIGTWKIVLVTLGLFVALTAVVASVYWALDVVMGKR